jgi:hypothetical protein
VAFGSNFNSTVNHPLYSSCTIFLRRKSGKQSWKWNLCEHLCYCKDFLWMF